MTNGIPSCSAPADRTRVTPTRLPAVIIRRAGMGDIEAVCEEVCRLGEVSATAAHWPITAYRAYLARKNAEENTQKKALFLACARAESFASSVVSGSDDTTWERIVGFAAFSAIPGMGECSLENMAVAKPWRKQGIGSRLLSAGLLWCRAHSGSGVWLEVRASNVDAIRLYEGAGFSIAGRRPDYYSGPVEAAIQMKKALESLRERC